MIFHVTDLFVTREMTGSETTDWTNSCHQFLIVYETAHKRATREDDLRPLAISVFVDAGRENLFLLSVTEL